MWVCRWNYCKTDDEKRKNSNRKNERRREALDGMREEIKDEARDKKMDICNFYNKN